jgi:hypothetical protein
VARVEEGEEGDGQQRAERDVDVEGDGARVESQRAAQHEAVERRQQQRCRSHRPAARRQHLLTVRPSAPHQQNAVVANSRLELEFCGGLSLAAGVGVTHTRGHRENGCI